MSETTKVINPVMEQSAAIAGRPAFPWVTVVSLAVVMAYADGFWMVSLRGAVGSIERTSGPFASWWRESTLGLPVFVLAVLGALILARHWLGPVLRRAKTVVAAMLMIAAAGTLVGVAEVAASSAYDYHLQSAQMQLMDSLNARSASLSATTAMTSTGSMAGMSSMGSMGSLAQQQQASRELQVRAVGYGSGIVLATNLVLVGLVVALRGGRLDVGSTRRRRKAVV